MQQRSTPRRFANWARLLVLAALVSFAATPLGPAFSAVATDPASAFTPPSAPGTWILICSTTGYKWINLDNPDGDGPAGQDSPAVKCPCCIVGPVKGKAPQDNFIRLPNLDIAGSGAFWLDRENPPWLKPPALEARVPRAPPAWPLST